MTNLNCKQVAQRLSKLKTPTPKTTDFEKEYGQRNNRWWDKLKKEEGINPQKHHVINLFICRYYNGSGFKCSKKCDECYSENRLEKEIEDPKNDIAPKNVFAKISRPEMYLWIIEALGLGNEVVNRNGIKKSDFEFCFDEITDIWSDKTKHHMIKMKDVRLILDKYGFTWENIEKELQKIEV